MTSNQELSQLEDIPKFQIQATLAQFATCTLYEATLTDDTAVFLVQLLPAKNENAVLTNEFLQRASIVSQLEHPNIAPILASGLTKDQHAYALLQKPRGTTLAAQLDDLIKDSAVSQIQFTQQIASALAVSHQAGIIHHHLAPENIYLTEDGTPFLVDLVVPVVPTTSIKSSVAITQLDYRPPEQREGKPLTPAANIYSLGVILYTLLDGEAPYLPESDWEIYDYREIPREIPLEQARSGLTQATYTLVQTCLWQREWNRYQSIPDVLQAMDTAVSAEKRAKLIPITPRTSRNKSLNIWIPLAILLVIILCLGAVFVGRNLMANEGSVSAPPLQSLPAETSIQVTQPSQPTKTNTPTPTVVIASTNPATNTPTVTNTPTATSTPSPTLTPTMTPTTIPPTATETITQACAPAPPTGWIRYTIQANDTLSGLASRGNTTISSIQEANCLDGNVLSLGRDIWLPASALPTDTPSPTPQPANNTSNGGNTSSQPNPTSPPKATVPPPPP